LPNSGGARTVILVILWRISPFAKNIFKIE
jgi:hypothetical protein